MALQVIGSGFGRTGTTSLKEALEVLGFGPCHHMEEVLAHSPQVAHWQAVAAGKDMDWNQVFAGYASQVDWPGAHVWRQTAAAFPEAKVIHSTRPDDKWWASFSRTIAKLSIHYKNLPLAPHVRDALEAGEKLIAEDTFHGKIAERDAALAALHRREAEVRDTIPAARLLVFDVAQGWQPLCAFLGKPVPDRPFPRRNKADDFWNSFGGEPA